MTYKEIIKKIKEIEDAIASGNYTIDYDCPNNINERIAPDGSTFYVLTDMDGIKSSNYFGSNRIFVAGISIKCELEYGEWESDLFDEIEDDYELPDDEYIDKDEIIERIQDIVCEADGFITGSRTEGEEQISVYETMTGREVEDYYMWEDRDIPMDVEEFVPAEETCDDTFVIAGKKYYIVPESIDSNTLIAVSEDAKPDKYGLYPTVMVISNEPIFEDSLDDINVCEIKPNEDMFNSSFCELVKKK